MSSPFISLDGPFVFSGNAPGVAWDGVTGGDGGGGDVTPFWSLRSTSMEPLAPSALAIAADKRRSSSGGRLSGCELRSSFSFFLSFFAGDPLLLMYAPGERFDSVDLSSFRKFSSLNGKWYNSGGFSEFLLRGQGVDVGEGRASSSRMTLTPGMRYSLALLCKSLLVVTDLVGRSPILIVGRRSSTLGILA